MTSTTSIIYKNELGNIYIELIADYQQKICYLNRILFDESFIVLYLLGLKTVFMDEKLNGIDKFVQTVELEEWNTYLKKNEKWNLIETNKYFNTCYISCDVKEALFCISEGYNSQ